jgi:hypothetical protein
VHAGGGKAAHLSILPCAERELVFVGTKGNAFDVGLAALKTAAGGQGFRARGQSSMSATGE